MTEPLPQPTLDEVRTKAKELRDAYRAAMPLDALPVTWRNFIAEAIARLGGGVPPSGLVEVLARREQLKVPLPAPDQTKSTVHGHAVTAAEVTSAAVALCVDYRRSLPPHVSTEATWQNFVTEAARSLGCLSYPGQMDKVVATHWQVNHNDPPAVRGQHGSDSDTEPAVEVNLVEDGLLWLINSTVFHPRGFALSYDPESRSMHLRGDGTEAWQYGTDPAHPGRVAIDAKFDAVRDLFERAARENGRG